MLKDFVTPIIICVLQDALNVGTTIPIMPWGDVNRK